MSTAPSVALRGGAEVAQATARQERKGWLASLKDEAVSFLKGDNNSPWAILAETVIGCVPILGQIVDARDIIKGLVEVAGAPASPLAWFNLITALIGLIPGAGDAVKRSLRSVKSGVTHIDELLDMIRRLYKGDPEKALREALDLGALRKHLNTILDNPNLTKHLGPEVRRGIDNIQANLNRQFDAFKREVDGWLAKGRKTSTDGQPGTPHPGTPPAKPNTTARAGTNNRPSQGNSASTNTPNAATQRTARFKTLAQKVLGVMGEHMADYHCQDVKGWGANSKMQHDQNGINRAKLNDGGHLIPLWPCIPRGRGIDAVWKSGGRKPYAIIEAKASYDPTKSLKALLGEAGDKTERGGAASGSGSGRGGGAGRRGGSAGPTTIRQTNGKVTQMGHGWVGARLQRAVGATSADWPVLRDGGKAVYSRHVLFFSIPQAVAHAEALILHTAGRTVQHSFHAAHATTREWTDSDIDKVVDNRAGIKDSARDRRSR
jgi:hypothetical protein